MFTLQSSALQSQLVDAGMDPALAQVLVSAIGNCAQPLQHNGPVTINADLNPQGQNAALTVNGYGNYPADASPTTPTTGAVGSPGALAAPGGQQFNPNGPFGFLLNNGPMRINAPLLPNGGLFAVPTTAGGTGTIYLGSPLSGPYSGIQVPIGAIIMWGKSVASIPAGFALCDGTANAAGTGIDMRDYFPRGKSSGTPNNTPAGSDTIPVATIAAAIAAHADHAHTIVAASIANEAAVTAGAALIARDTSALLTSGVEKTDGTSAPSGVLGHTGTGSDVTAVPAHKDLHFIERLS